MPKTKFVKTKWRCWFARYEEAVVLDGVTKGSVRVRLERVAVLGIHGPPSFPPVAHVPIELIPEEYRVTGTELTIEITMGQPPAKHLRREGPKPESAFESAFEDDGPLDEAFGLLGESNDTHCRHRQGGRVRLRASERRW